MEGDTKLRQPTSYLYKVRSTTPPNNNNIGPAPGPDGLPWEFYKSLLKRDRQTESTTLVGTLAAVFSQIMVSQTVPQEFIGGG